MVLCWQKEKHQKFSANQPGTISMVERFQSLCFDPLSEHQRFNAQNIGFSNDGFFIDNKQTFQNLACAARIE